MTTQSRRIAGVQVLSAATTAAQADENWRRSHLLRADLRRHPRAHAAAVDVLYLAAPDRGKLQVAASLAAHPATCENYLKPFESSVPFLQLFVNSLRITLAVTLGQLVTCSLAGYAFARLRFPGNNTLFLILLASLMVPNQVTIIPIYLSMVSLGLMDNPLAIILPGVVSVFGVFLMRQFFMTLPQELLDAAHVDGAGHARVFLQIAVPLSGASLATLAIITFNAVWNSYFLPLIFLKSWDNMTLPQGIALLTGYMGSGNPSVVMAAVTMAILPVLIVFIIAQRWIIEALTRTGING